MADSVEGAAPQGAHWEPLPFRIELGFPVAMTGGPASTPSRLALSTPEGGRMLAGNPFDSPSVAGSGRSECWPYPTSGSSKPSSEPLDGFLRRRYLETLFLPDMLYTLPSFASDLIRIKSTPADGVPTKHPLLDLLAPMLLPLSAIETKYRKQLPPHCTRTLNPKAVVDLTEDDILSEEALRVLETGAAFRRGCKAAETDASLTMGKKWAEELERREIFLQVILTLLYIAHLPKAQVVTAANGGETEPPKKKSKKRKRKEARPPWEAVAQDPKMALELLTDRLSIWQAVSDLGIGDRLQPAAGTLKAKGKGKLKETYSERVRRFFDEVLAKYFLKSHYSFCKNFHLKLFGTTLPSRRTKGEPVDEPPPLKKARKSSELLPPSTTTLSRTSTSRAVLSRDVRGSSRSAASPPPSIGMRRSASVVSLNPVENRRSRSESIDPNPVEPPRRGAGLTRQASGKNLFQGREVGLMRRTGSAVIAKAQKDRGGGESQTQPLQRQNSLGMLTRRPSESWRNPASTLPAVASSALVHATPVKPKFQNSSARPTGRNPFFKSHPTPIKEEASFIAETPMAPNRHGRAVPQLGSGRLLAFRDTVEEIGEDDLGDLMYMTDEEDGEGQGEAGVPETPVKG